VKKKSQGSFGDTNSKASSRATKGPPVLIKILLHNLSFKKVDEGHLTCATFQNW